MSTDLTIRPLQSQDRAQWARLWAAYNAFYGRTGETALPDRVIDLSWARLMDNGEPLQGLVAVRGGSLVGLAHLIFHLNMIQENETCYLQDLFTTPEMRGLGVARRLIAAAGATCRARGARDVYWHTHSGNATARALYDKVATNTEFLVYRMGMD